MTDTTDKMHTIGFWIDRLGSGGSERVITTIASDLANRNDYKVRLYLHHRDGEYEDELHPRIERITLNNTWRGKPGLQTIQALYNFFIVLKSQNNEVIMTSGYMFNAALIVLRFLSGNNTKILVRETNTFSQVIRHKKSFLSKLIARAARRLYQFSDLIICPSAGVKQDLIDVIPLLQKKIVVIPNPVDFETIESLKDQPLPAHLNINPHFILSVGRLVPIKGFDDLIEAWASLETDQQYDLVILGEGPERKRLIEKVESLGLSNRFHLPGFDRNPYKYMNRAKLYVLTSRYEGLPNALIQALSCGCPAAAYDCPSGPKEIIDRPELGSVVPLFNVKSLSLAIQSELEKPRRPQQRISAMKAYDKSNISNHYHETISGFFS